MSEATTPDYKLMCPKCKRTWAVSQAEYFANSVPGPRGLVRRQGEVQPYVKYATQDCPTCTGEYTEAEETAITLTIAQVCHFAESESFFTCTLCGKKLGKHYIGQPLNERMLAHFEQEHLAAVRRSREGTDGR